MARGVEQAGPSRSYCTILRLGDHPPKVPSRNWLINDRKERILLRVVTVILVLAVAAIAVIIALMIAGYH